jgi:hypothetical protein
MPPTPVLTVSAPIERTLHRRRVLLAALLVTAFVTFVWAALAGGRMWGLHVTADGLLVLYLAVLIHVRNSAAERDMTSRGLGR